MRFHPRANASLGIHRAVVVAAVVVAVIAGMAVRADAAPRKRVVVLDFDGPKADKFHDDVVRLVKKSFTLVPADKWLGTADELGATKPTDANVKKIAKKLKIDGIIIGKIEKRRDDYLVHLKLRSGKSGAIANSADTKSSGPRLDAKASMDVKDELLDAIDQLGTIPIKGGDDDDSGDDDADAKPAAKKPTKAGKKPAKGGDDDDDDSADAAPKKSGFGKKKPAQVARGGDADDDDDDAKPAAKKPAGKAAAKKPAAAASDDADDGAPDSSHDDDDSPLKAGKRPAKAPAIAKKPPDDGSEDKSSGDSDSGDSGDSGDGGGKKVAAKTDDDDGGGVEKSSGDVGGPLDVATALSPGQRAVDASFGLSVVSRQLGFTHSAALTNTPPGYKGAVNPGAVLDVEIYPFAIGHTRKGPLAGLGLLFMYDKVLKITSGADYKDGTGAEQSISLPTSMARFEIGAIFRHPFNDSATSPVIGGSLSYSSQAFTINTAEPGGMTADIPSVSYAIIEPAVRFQLPVSGKLSLLANAGVQIITNAGEISDMAQYGQATVLGIEAIAGGDYMITNKLFARATVSLETIGFTFKGNGTLSNNRDGDPTTQDVFGARDTYYGGMVTVGYLY